MNRNREIVKRSVLGNEREIEVWFRTSRETNSEKERGENK